MKGNFDNMMKGFGEFIGYLKYFQTRKNVQPYDISKNKKLLKKTKEMGEYIRYCTKHL